MPYVTPEQVVSPQAHWRTIAVIYDGGPGFPALAYGTWDGDKVIGVRWSGSDAPGDSLGNPQSTAHATWFILPAALGVAALRMLLEKQAVGDPGVRGTGLALAVEDFCARGLFSPSGLT